jgi:hypothetical protein
MANKQTSPLVNERKQQIVSGLDTKSTADQSGLGNRIYCRSERNNIKRKH